jgi:phosphoribosylamine---glycine ligase
VALCEAALDHRLDQVHADWDTRAALGVVLAAGGYPDAVRKGDVIAGLDAIAELPGKVFHAGTTMKDGQVHTSGGRVLCAVGLGDSVSAAQAQAYALVNRISWTGMQRGQGCNVVATSASAQSRENGPAGADTGNTSRSAIRVVRGP